MCHTMPEARNPRNLLTSRIPVLQGPKDSAFNVESHTPENTYKNTRPRISNAMDVVYQIIYRNVAKSQVTSQMIILIDRISPLPRVQTE